MKKKNKTKKQKQNKNKTKKKKKNHNKTKISILYYQFQDPIKKNHKNGQNLTHIYSGKSFRKEFVSIPISRALLLFYNISYFHSVLSILYIYKMKN